MARARGVDIIGPMSVQAATADEQLMRAYAGGDATAFETLYDRHAARVWRYILRSTGDAATADDLAQEVWFSVARQAGQYAPRASAPGLPLARFTTWLFTIARHRVVDHLRATRPQASLDAPAGDDAGQTLADTLAAPSGFGPVRRIETRQHGGSQVGTGAGALKRRGLVVARDEFVLGRARHRVGGHAMVSSVRRSAARA